MRLNIYQVKTNEFFQVYDDLVRSLVGSLTDIGHACTVTLNGFVPEAVNVLVGSTIFASRHLALAEALKEKPYILYQLESLDDRHGLLPQWPEYWALLQNATAIWDYSRSGVEYLRRKGLLQVRYVPPAFHRSMEVLRPRQAPDIDVLFFGSPHERRHRVVEALQARGIGVVNLDAVFGARRNRYISRAKIVLNMHAWDELNDLETVRLSFLLSNRVFVVSEAADHDPYEGGVIYAPYDRLVECCVEYLGKSAAERNNIAEIGHSAMRRIDFVEILRRTLAEMGPTNLERLLAPPAEETHAHDPHNLKSNRYVRPEEAVTGQEGDAGRVHLINLDRSADRLRSFERTNRHILPVIRFAAIDGTTVDRRSLVERGLFAPNVDYTDGAVGVALSHLILWDLAINQNRPITVAEDDAVFNSGFPSLSEELLTRVKPDWHIIFWGYNFDSPVVVEWMPSAASSVLLFREDDIRRNLNAFQAATLQPQLLKVAQVCGLTSYTISPAGARMLKNFCLPIRDMLIHFEGLGRNIPNYALDVMMNGIFRRLTAYLCFPPLVVTPNDKRTSLTTELPGGPRR